MMEGKLEHIFNAMVCGASQSGKTWFVKRLIGHIHPPLERVLYYYSIYQPIYDTFEGNVTFIEGLPTSPPDGSKRTLIILDDAISEIQDNKFITKLFTKYSHHFDTSVVLISQNLYHKGKEMRTISLQAHYIVLFPNRRDQTQVTTLGRQVFPGKSKFFKEVYEDATREPYSYLFLDLKPNTREDLRVRSNIFSENGKPPTVYVPK